MSTTIIIILKIEVEQVAKQEAEKVVELKAEKIVWKIIKKIKNLLKKIQIKK